MKKFWFFCFIVYCFLFLIGLFPYISRVDLNIFSAILIVVDGIAIIGIYRYATNKVIRHLWIRILYILIAMILLLRSAVVCFFALPAMFPWVWSSELLVSLCFMAIVPFVLLNAFGLWRYATQPVLSKSRHSRMESVS